MISGNLDGSTVVYRAVELPLTSDEQAVGSAIRSGLEGYRQLTAAEENLPVELGKSPLFRDYDEWTEKYGGVTVLESEGQLKLRARGAAAPKRTESILPGGVSNHDLGKAVLEAFARM